MSPGTLFKILLTSVVVSKQRLLHRNEFVQHLQNYKCQDVNQYRFRKPLQSSKTAMKSYHPKSAHTFFRVVHFLANFYVFTLNLRFYVNFLRFTFALLWQNQSNYICR